MRPETLPSIHRKSGSVPPPARTRLEPRVHSLLLWGREALRPLGERESLVGAERILGEVLGLSRFDLYRTPDRSLAASEAGRFRRLIRRRLARVPLAYVLEKAYFWNETLKVTPACLVPRPETELLVERFLKHSGLAQDQEFTFLDLGSGSGAIGLALLRSFPGARATFSDISKEALKIARENLRAYGLLERAEILESDLFSSFHGRIWDAIVCNPPYVAEADWPLLEPEIACEPRQALDGGRDGLDFYRRIAVEAPAFLVGGGCLFLEVGDKQAARVIRLFEKQGLYFEVNAFQDDGGIDRVVMARRVR